jgi:flagellar hook assembly protein FlgD
VIPPNQQDPKNPITYGTRIEVSLIPAIQQDLLSGKVTGTITIFDAVGNTIYSNDAMAVDEQRVKLFLTWDGKTNKGVYAGGGTYLVRTVIHDEVRNKTQTIRQSVGVKQAK